MALPASGSISLLDIAAEFDPDYDDNAPYRLTDFYAGGAYVPAGATNADGDAIPASGKISIGAFRGARARTSSRERTYYRRAAAKPAAPASAAFGAWAAPGGGWSTSDPGATTTQSVWQVTLTQHFDHATTQDATTFDRNVWSAVAEHEARVVTFWVTVSVDDATPTNGDTVTFTARPGGTATGAVTYQWQRLSGGAWSDISGENGSTYDHTRSSAGSVTVRCWATRAGISRVSASAAATWSAAPVTLPNARAPSLSIGAIGSVNEGAAAFDVVATPSGGLYDTISYRWRAALGTIVGSGPTAAYTPPANDGAPGDRVETIDVDADVTGTGPPFGRARAGTSDSTSPAEGGRATFTIANVPVRRTRRRSETRYRRATAKPGIAQVASPAGWTTSRPASNGQSVWQAIGTINERSADGGAWAFVSASWVVLAAPAIHVRAVHPAPSVAVDAASAEIIIDASPPSSGWRGEHGASISGTWLRGFTRGLIPNLGTRSQPAQVPFAAGFTGEFVAGEFVAGARVSATVWAVYSDGGVSPEVTDSDIGPDDDFGEGGDDP